MADEKQQNEWTHTLLDQSQNETDTDNHVNKN